MKSTKLILVFFLTISASLMGQNYEWEKLATDPYLGKQDDITFIDENNGWYINGYGKIYKTEDGGSNWIKQLERKGSFFRAVAFLDKKKGFIGTVGTEYFPNVSDTIPLYRTTDGGKTLDPVQYTGPYVKGICAIDIVKEQFIDHGKIAYKHHIFAVGRVGSPANIMISNDSGESWMARSMNSQAKMLFDIKMFNKNEGVACAATSRDISNSHALILKTVDGGNTWYKVFESSRPFETTWKASFPTDQVGYVTIQSYNPDPAIAQQRIAKTVDGGETWKEINLVENQAARPFGIGFIDENVGYVGTMTSGYMTNNGGFSWQPVDLGKACNKIRIYKNKSDGKGSYGYAIGVDVLRLKNLIHPSN